MIDFLADFLNCKVSIITQEGRYICGILQGTDHVSNALLFQAKEYRFAIDTEPTIINLGVYLIRSDSIAVVGLVDENKERSIDYSLIRAEALPAIQL